MLRFGIYTNVKKDPGLATTRSVMAILERHGLSYCLDEELASKLPGCCVCSGSNTDVLIVLGGDGTMLAASRKYASSGALLLGVNIGRLGFLLDGDADSFEATLERILRGEYAVQERIMLKASVISKIGEEIFSGYALNEAVVSQKNMMRIINLEVLVNEESAGNYRSDGVIVSTPSGSTAYSLSAGGPVIAPTVDVFLITPMYPHSLQSCSFVISGEDEVKINIQSELDNAALTLDGQIYFDIPASAHVVVRKTDFRANFLRTAEKSFYTLLKEKLAEWK